MTEARQSFYACKRAYGHQNAFRAHFIQVFLGQICSVAGDSVYFKTVGRYRRNVAFAVALDIDEVFIAHCIVERVIYRVVYGYGGDRADCSFAYGYEYFGDVALKIDYYADNQKAYDYQQHFKTLEFFICFTRHRIFYARTLSIIML